MKIMGVVAMAAVAGASLSAGENAAAPEATVIVCMETDRNIPGGTRELASEMFASIGVRIDWRKSPSCPVGAGAIVVRLCYGAPDNPVPNDLALARPYEGTHIVVFPDRVQKVQKLNCVRGPKLLADVLVHEITHILQGICRHSATGVMKARWEENDYFEMSRKPLPFAQEDIDLIYYGLKVRQARLATAATAGVSRAPVAGQ